MGIHKTNLPCPICGSSDAGSIYKNTSDTGEIFYQFTCFSGNHTGRNYIAIEDPDTYEEEILGKKREEPEVNTETNTSKLLLDNLQYVSLKDPSHPWGVRGISDETCRFFGVAVRPNSPLTGSVTRTNELIAAGEPTHGLGLIFNYFDRNKKELIAQKMRTSERPKGYWLKESANSHKNIGFFGQQLWSSPSIRTIIITFGELDAMATYQMLGTAVVSISDGDNSAAKQVEREYDWLNKFEKIILIPDNDESCRSVMPAIAARFPRKVRIVDLTVHKDPNDYLREGHEAEFRKEFQAARPFSPEKIKSLSDLKGLLFEDPPVPVATYPWEGLNKMTGGIWAGDLVCIKAFPKVGKTTVSSEIAYHLNRTTDHNVGLIYLEETQRDLIFRFASMHMSKNLQRQDIQASINPEELEECSRDLFPDDSDRIFILDHWGSCSSDFLESKIKEFVLAKRCQFIFFDHISMAITDESNKDERLALDRLVASIKSLTTGIPDTEVTSEGDVIHTVRQPTIFTVTHVNDDGKPRGSRALVQQSNLVISINRDKTAATEAQRNLTEVIVEDNRRFGESGPACYLSYDKMTSRLTEVPTTQQEDDTPVMDKKGGFVWDEYKSRAG